MQPDEQLVGLADLTTYLRMFSILVNAGVNLLHCLRALDKSITCAALKQANARVLAEVEADNTLSKAMAGSPEVFPLFAIGMVRAGEIGGVLDVTLERAASFYQQQLDYRRQRFIYLATAQVLGHEQEEAYLAAVRELEERVLIQYFCYMFGTMLGSGVPVLQALDVAGSMLPEVNAHDATRPGLRRGVEQARDDIRNHESLTPALAAVGFPPGVVTLFSIGEESGTLDRTAVQAGDLLGAEIDGRMQEALGMNEG